MKMGTRDLPNSSWGDIVKVKEFDKPYIHKILDGPATVRTVYYPAYDDEGVVRKPSFIVKDSNSSILNQIAGSHRAIIKRKFHEKYGYNDETKKKARMLKSPFDYTTAYHCLILAKGEQVPKVQRAQYPYSIYKEIFELESKRKLDVATGIVDDSLLENGLLFSFWFNFMKKRKDASRGDHYTNIEYETSVASAPLKQMMSSKWLNGPMEIDIDNHIVTVYTPDQREKKEVDVFKYELFTEQEWSAIANTEYESIHDLVIPRSEDEQQEKLESTGLALDAKDENGNYLIEHAEELFEEIKRKGYDKMLPIEDSAVGDGYMIPEQTATAPVAEVEQQGVEVHAEAINPLDVIKTIPISQPENAGWDAPQTPVSPPTEADFI